MGLYGLNVAGERLGELNNDGLGMLFAFGKLIGAIAQTRQALIEPERMELINQRFEMEEAIEGSATQIVDIWQAYFSRDVNTTPLATSFNEQLEAFC